LAQIVKLVTSIQKNNLRFSLCFASSVMSNNLFIYLFEFSIKLVEMGEN